MAAAVVVAVGASVLASPAGAARGIEVVESSVTGWTIENGVASPVIGKIVSEGLPKKRLNFKLNAATGQFDNGGVAIVATAMNVGEFFEISANGRVGYKGKDLMTNVTASNIAFTRPATIMLSVTISDSKDKAAPVTEVIRIKALPQTPLTIDDESLTGWSIVAEKKQGRVGKIEVAERGARQTEIKLTRLYASVNDSAFSGPFKISDAGVVSYNGSTILCCGNTQRYPQTVEMTVEISDKKGRYATITKTITITVREPRPPTIVVLGAPYECCWDVTAGSADGAFAYVYAFPQDGDLVNFRKREHLRYEITSTAAIVFGFKIGSKSGQLRYSPKRGAPIPEHIESVRINVTVSDSSGKAEAVETYGIVKIIHPGASTPEPEPAAEPEVYRGPVSTTCPYKPGHANFGTAEECDYVTLARAAQICVAAYRNRGTPIGEVDWCRGVGWERLLPDYAG